MTSSWDETAPAVPLAQPRLRHWHRAALALASGLVLAVPFNQPWLFVLCWVAFVPLLAALEDVGVRIAYGLGVVAGTACYIAGTPWIVDFLVLAKGYGPVQSVLVAIVVWLYNAQLIGLLAALWVWLRRDGLVHESLLFALLAAGLYAAFPTPVKIHLGESQSQFSAAIQAVEITGVHGLDFLIALVNSAVWLGIAHGLGRPVRAADRRATAAVAAAFALWLGYGAYAAGVWEDRIASWPTVRAGVVQPNESPSIRVPEPRPGYSRAYPWEMAMTEKLVAAGAEIVIWPETRFKGYFGDDRVRNAFQRQMGTLQTPLLFQDIERVHAWGDHRDYNAAVLIDGDGTHADTYRKIKRIAFGEYVPLMTEVPAVRDWAEAYFGSFFNAIAAGDGPVAFQPAGFAGDFAIVPLICYEAMFPVFVAEAVGAAPGPKWVTIMSNDGWFGDTRGPYQHLHASALRAVENRVTVVNALNNGPSGVIAPDGRFVWRSPLGDTAGYAVELPYSTAGSGSFFSRHPYAFLIAVYAGLTLTVLVALWCRYVRRSVRRSVRTAR